MYWCACIWPFCSTISPYTDAVGLSLLMERDRVCVWVCVFRCCIHTRIASILFGLFFTLWLTEKEIASLHTTAPNKTVVARRSCVKKRQHDVISFVFVLIRILILNESQERRQHFVFSVYLSLFEDEHYIACMHPTVRKPRIIKKKKKKSIIIFLQTVFLLHTFLKHFPCSFVNHRVLQQ